MNNLQDRIGPKRIVLLGLLLEGIRANANVLMELSEYSHIHVTVEEYNAIDGLEKQLAALRKQITERR